MDSYQAVYNFLKDNNLRIKGCEVVTNITVAYNGQKPFFETTINFEECLTYYKIGIDGMKQYYGYELFSTGFQDMKYIKGEYLQISDKKAEITIKIFMVHQNV